MYFLDIASFRRFITAHSKSVNFLLSLPNLILQKFVENDAQLPM